MNDLKERDLSKKKSSLRENIEAITLAIILALFIRTFVVQAFKIPSGSMKETLLVGDHILVNKFIYGIKIPFIQKTLIPIKNPQREDIIVFKYPIDPKKDFIKRVIGIPGDVIEIRDKQIFINGKNFGDKVYESYKDPDKIPAESSHRDNYGPVTVPLESLFVMGDNRDNSHDSRFWGFVPLEDVKGKAFLIYWSSVLPRGWIWNWNWETLILRWDRLGKTLK
ncbi:MAG: signal peptidase I [Deltaproteobacteria bacterium]|nr:signal peptidase I [Deltaproteobacteria bacterium]